MHQLGPQASAAWACWAAPLARRSAHSRFSPSIFPPCGGVYGLGGGLLLRPSIVRGACMGLTAVCFYGTPSFGGRVWAWSAVCFYGTSSFGGRVWAWSAVCFYGLPSFGGVYGLDGGLFLRHSIVGGRVWAWLRFVSTALHRSGGVYGLGRQFVSTALHRSGGVYGLGCGLRPPRSLLNRLVRTRTAAPAPDKSPSGPTTANQRRRRPGGENETRTGSGRRRPLHWLVGRSASPHMRLRYRPASTFLAKLY